MAVGDWLPLASTVGGAVVGLGGVYATIRSGKRQQETTVAVARFQAEHQAQLADRERKLQKRETEYEQLLAWAVSIDTTIFRTMPRTADPSNWERGAYVLRDLRDEAKTAELRTREYVWSPKVADWFETLYNQLANFVHAADNYLSATTESKIDALNALGEEEDAFADYVQGLIVQVRFELMGELHPEDKHEDPPPQ